MKKIISALFLCMLLSAVPELQAQNIQLHYDFGRSLYDQDLKGRPHCREVPSRQLGKYLLLYRYGLYVRRSRFRLLGDSP